MNLMAVYFLFHRFFFGFKIFFYFYLFVFYLILPSKGLILTKVATSYYLY